jgi:hypothetical protein
MAKEKAKENKERKIKENGKQFLKKKTNHFNVEECKTELKRLEGTNQKCSRYYSDVRNRLAELAF